MNTTVVLVAGQRHDEFITHIEALKTAKAGDHLGMRVMSRRFENTSLDVLFKIDDIVISRDNHKDEITTTYLLSQVASSFSIHMVATD